MGDLVNDPVPAAEAVRVTLECSMYLHRWHCRLYVVLQDDEGEYAEPYVVSFDTAPLWMAGPGWMAASVLQEVTRHLDAALRDGYE